ncbi:MAG TPA: CRTAC1 family protein [Terriglobia bacterium]|nr:CRTAC1 family protein [Terriglobia bacterium]
MMDSVSPFGTHKRGGPSRRAFLGRALASMYFVFPLFRDGSLGQPVATREPWFADIALHCGLGAFRDRCGSPAKDYLVETLGSGVALFDYNNDGLTDILLVNGSSFELLDNPALPRASSRLFRNNGDGTFTDVTKESGLINEGWGMGVAVADFDNDGYQDVFITNFGKNVLFHNDSNGHFTDITRDAGVEGGNWSTGCAWGDFDGDGRLDLYVARYVNFDRSRIPKPGDNSYCLYHAVPVACGPMGLPGIPDLFYKNEGGGKFREASAEIGIRGTENGYGLGVVWCDFDNDGRPDIFVANDSTPNFLWHNLGNGTFEEIGLEAGCALTIDGRVQSSMGIALGDYDNDGWMDILVTNFAEDYNTLYHNQQGFFEDVSYEAGLGTASYSQLGWGTGFIDFDNDGWRDLFVANGHIYPQADEAGNHYLQRNQLFRNLRNGRFQLLSKEESGFSEKKSSRGAAWGDLNNDGKIEILVNNIDAQPFLYSPVHPADGHWVRFRLVGSRSNRDAVGARVKVLAGGTTQYDEVRSGESFLSTSDVRLHFGLGAATVVDRVEIHWPDGSVESHANLPADRQHTLQQKAGP